jgi:hypothetical protein
MFCLVEDEDVGPLDEQGDGLLVVGRRPPLPRLMPRRHAPLLCVQKVQLHLAVGPSTATFRNVPRGQGALDAVEQRIDAAWMLGPPIALSRRIWP